MGALLTIAAVTFAPGLAQAGFGDRSLRTGSRGHDVTVLQSWLTHLGIPTHVDGVFGPTTRGHVKHFERARHLKVNGIVEPSQARMMRRFMKRLAPSAGAKPTPKPAPAGKARFSRDGRTVVAPRGAPHAVRAAIRAANRITHEPYRYGGGHASFASTGYDCSGAVSYALHGAGLLSSPRASSGLGSWGKAGKGRWISVYANAGHAYMTIAGIRFDTSGPGPEGPRWRHSAGSRSGYAVRHWRGL